MLRRDGSFYGAEKKAVIDMCHKNLEAGTIVRIDPADAKNTCNATLVTKKNGDLRACMNVVSLNKGCKPDPFPVPSTQEIGDQMD